MHEQHCDARKFTKTRPNSFGSWSVVVFEDGSATVERGEVIEIGYEGDKNAWMDALQYLEDRQCPDIRIVFEDPLIVSPEIEQFLASSGFVEVESCNRNE